MSSSVLVVGGGLAGLLAAREHARAGRRVVLLEAAPVVGGAIAETHLGPLALNAGAEAFSIGRGAVDALLAELGIDGAAVSPREGLGSRLVSAAGVHRAPGGGLLGIPGRPLAADVRAVLGTAGALRAALEPLLPARIGARPGATVAETVSRRLGRRVLERLVAPIVGGVHSADPATLELAAASPALVAGLARHGSLVRAVREIRGAGTASAGTRVRSLAPTMAALPAALRADLLARGGLLRTGVEVVEAGRTGDTWWARTASGETLEASELVLAGPPDMTRALLAEAAPEIAAAIPQAPSAAVRLVALALDAEALDAFPSGTGALVAPGTPGIRAKALTHASAKWEHVGEQVRAAFPDAASPHLVRLSYGRPGEPLPEREGIEGLALADASRILGTELTREQLLGAVVIDWDRAMSQALPGHRAALDHLTALLAEEPTLHLTGSWRAGTGIDAIVRAEHHHGSHPTAEGTPA
ncbi:protoporphyrinogen/coproporphyrinogen oxidase [Brachybacterium sp. J153]|uniref:protoporphyrinogen/coproporphyrinogen oxidase n=1 Tax=Brachybacterium sp. J153 TaxID=3116488 RepID=UPI002E779076|nr:FAD-dependent oxidoreductase [Brachybacterium sp. J153]MEE1617956.1 FAD-dependent oxidoreductase [Brachybacterium sp. J153]